MTEQQIKTGCPISRFYFFEICHIIPNVISKKQLQHIKKFAIESDWDQAFSGKSYGNRHLHRMVKISKHLARHENAQVSLVEAGAYLHDFPLTQGKDDNHKKNKKSVEKILELFSLSQEERDAITECVASHEGTTNPKTLEAKVVHDADVLEKSSILGIIRHTWKMTNQNKLDPSAVKNNDVNKIINHILWRRKRLQTPIAKKIATYLTMPVSKHQTKNIITIAANMAARGITTEKIAATLYKHLNQKQNTRLREQLNLGYLKLFK